VSCRIDDGWAYHGLRCIRLENARCAIDVLPGLGGKILRFTDKRRDRDWLWHSSRVLPHRSPLHANFDDNWAGGWDDVFPTALVADDEMGERLPHMGELWTSDFAWDVVDSSRERVEVVLRTATPITTARFEKRLALDGDAPALAISYRIENVGTQPFACIWGLHPALAISEAFRFDVPARRAQVALSGGPGAPAEGLEYEWPRLVGSDVRLARPESDRSFALHYLWELEAGWVAATDRAAKAGFGLVFDPAVFTNVWAWLVYGGWRGYTHAILEPWTGRPATLSEAVNQGHARRLEAGEQLATEVTALLYDGVDAVGSLEADGRVGGVASGA
jgi:galactose mutarotase-like enzyme